MKKIIVTTSWDDGHKLDLKVARILKNYSIKGTFYVCPRDRELRQSELISSREIVMLSKDFEIGAHTMTHPLLPNDLATAWYKFRVKNLNKFFGENYNVQSVNNFSEAKKEIVDSKKYLENLLDKRVISFCYPGGRHNSKIRDFVKESGFLYARTVERHKFEMSKNVYASPTSLHTFKQYQDIFKIAWFSRWNPRAFFENMNWENLAKRAFDNTKEGGVYHIWGHSWIIDKKNEWDKLERMLSYIANRKNVRYLT